MIFINSIGASKNEHITKPEDWEVGEFKTDLTIKGRIGWRGYKTSDLVEEGPIVLGGENIKSSYFIDYTNVKHLSVEKFNESPEIQLKPDDILLVCRGNLGEVGHYKGEYREATINPSIVILSNFKGDSTFLFYYLISPKGQASIDMIKSGSSVPAIYQSEVRTLLYPKPPYLEQKAIANILSSLDKKIELNQQTNKTLEAIAQAIFKHWFIDFEFPNEGGKPYKSSGGEMVDSELGEIPKGWDVKKLSEVANFVKGFGYKGSEKSNAGGEYVFITLNSVLEGGGFKRKFSFLSSKRVKEKYFVKEGDIIIPNTEQTKTGRLIGFPAFVEFPLHYQNDVGVFSHHITKVIPFLQEICRVQI